MPSVTRKVKSPKIAKDAIIEPEVETTKFVSDSLEKAHKKRKDATKAKKAGAKKGVAKANLTKKKRRGIVYIKHLPHGFFEEQLKSYFTQFGAVTRLRLARSTRTLNSKGYAFIEFKYPEVAQIAAEAMHNYIMFKQIIKTVFIGPDQVKYDYFRSGIRKIWKDDRVQMTSHTIEARAQVVENNNRLMTSEDENKRNKIIGQKIKRDAAKLAAMGVDYDLNAVTSELPQSSTASTIAMDLDDDEDESVDISKVDFGSDDEAMDLDCSQNSDDDNDDDEEPPKIDVAVVKKAVKFAEDVKKTVMKKHEINPELTKKGKKTNVVIVAKPVSPVVADVKKGGKRGQKKEVDAPKPEIIAETVNKAKKGGKNAKTQKVVVEEPEKIKPVPVVSKKNAKITSKAEVAPRASVRAPKAKIEVEVVEQPAKGKKTKSKVVPVAPEPEPEVVAAPKQKRAAKVAPVIESKPPMASPTTVAKKEPREVLAITKKTGRITKKKSTQKIPAEKLKMAAKAVIQEEAKPVKAAKSKIEKKAKK